LQTSLVICPSVEFRHFFVSQVADLFFLDLSGFGGLKGGVADGIADKQDDPNSEANGNSSDVRDALHDWLLVKSGV
jgi:hypothetical protein